MNGWLEGRRYQLRGYATGGYACRCGTCGAQFMGDKRALTCLPCAADAALAAERERAARIAEEFRDPNPFPTIYAAIAAAIRGDQP